MYNFVISDNILLEGNVSTNSLSDEALNDTIRLSGSLVASSITTTSLSDNLNFVDSVFSPNIYFLNASDSFKMSEVVTFSGDPYLTWEETNDQGHYPTAFCFRWTELKKGEKIVATDIVDLYDVDINTNTLADGDLLTYEEASQKWINQVGGGGGGGCNVITGYNYGAYTNSLFVNATTLATTRNGSFQSPFISLDECFLWLCKQCITLPKNDIITIQMLSDLHVTTTTSLNFLYGYNLIINGNNNTLTIDFQLNSLSYSNGTFYPDSYTNTFLSISNSHSINKIENCTLNINITT